MYGIDVNVSRFIFSRVTHNKKKKNMKFDDGNSCLAVETFSMVLVTRNQIGILNN